jgi:hypothetical protein
VDTAAKPWKSYAAANEGAPVQGSRVVFALVVSVANYGNRKSLTYATLGRKTSPGRGVNTEISPLRYAPVEMTKVRATLP